MVFETALQQYAFLVGRLIYGGLLAFMGLNHFLSTDDMTSYAKMKGVPRPKFMVLLSGIVLITGGLSIVSGVYPMIGSLLIIAFMVPVSLEMHDFWTIEDPEAKKQDMTQFLKNMVIVGAALLLLAVAGTNWPYALSLGA